MDFVTAYNELTYFDGVVFTIWIGAMYLGKCWIDRKFR